MTQEKTAVEQECDTWRKDRNNTGVTVTHG